jgi:hypothetical protein
LSCEPRAMHGIIFSELQNYAESKHGKGTWDAWLAKAGLGKRVDLTLREYPDAEIEALLAAASSMAGRPIAAVLEDFGEFIVPALMKMHGHLLRPGWKTIEVIDNTEGTIHTVVRVKNPGAKPPQLQTKRISSDEVMLVYTSPRQMCSLAIGIDNGLAKRFHENIYISQKVCMRKGADHCEIFFRKIREGKRAKPAKAVGPKRN